MSGVLDLDTVDTGPVGYSHLGTITIAGDPHVYGMHGLMYLNGYLYADLSLTSRPYEWLVKIDPMTLTGTLVGPIHTANNDNVALGGIVPFVAPAAVPLPASALAGGALLGVLGVARGWKRRRMRPATSPRGTGA